MNGMVKGTSLFIDNRWVDNPSLATKLTVVEWKADNFYLPLCLRHLNIHGHQACDTHH